MPLLETVSRFQQSDHDCGPTAFEVLFRFWYATKPLPAWGDLADPHLGVGLDLLHLMCRKEFPKTATGDGWSLEDLAAFSRFTPVLTMVHSTDLYAHWVVVRGVQRGRVYYHCPTNGRESKPAAEWEAAWRDERRDGYDRCCVTGWR